MIGVREKQKQIYTCNLVYWDKYFTESSYISQKMSVYIVVVLLQNTLWFTQKDIKLLRQELTM